MNEKKRKKTEQEGKRAERDGLVTVAAGLFLLAYSLKHQYTDPVHYGWGLSPYLFPTILSVVLTGLGLMLLRGRRTGK